MTTPTGQAPWGPFSLQGKVALVTGGAAGMGAGITKAMSDAGARVIVIARRPDAQASIDKVVEGVTVIQGDLAPADAPDRLFAEALKVHGRIDILVNNAAAILNSPFLDIDAAFIDSMLAVNIRASLLLCRAFAAACVAGKHKGKIVNISSIEAIRPSIPSSLVVYGTSKGGASSMVPQLARELGPMGISVNGIAPGAVLHEDLIRKRAGGDFNEERTKAGLAGMKARANTDRLGTPEDIAYGVVYLASAASDYVSGQILVIDGGCTRT